MISLSFFVCLVSLLIEPELSSSCTNLSECLCILFYPLYLPEGLSPGLVRSHLERLESLLMSQNCVPDPRTPSRFTSSFWWHVTCSSFLRKGANFWGPECPKMSPVHLHASSQYGWLRTRRFPLSIMKAKTVFRQLVLLLRKPDTLFSSYFLNSC